MSMTRALAAKTQAVSPVFTAAPSHLVRRGRLSWYRGDVAVVFPDCSAGVTVRGPARPTGFGPVENGHPVAQASPAVRPAARAAPRGQGGLRYARGGAGIRPTSSTPQRAPTTTGGTDATAST